MNENPSEVELQLNQFLMQASYLRIPDLDLVLGRALGAGVEFAATVMGVEHGTGESLASALKGLRANLVRLRDQAVANTPPSVAELAEARLQRDEARALARVRQDERDRERRAKEICLKTLREDVRPMSPALVEFVLGEVEKVLGGRDAPTS